MSSLGKAGCAGAVVLLMLGVGMGAQPASAQQQQPVAPPSLSQPTPESRVPGMAMDDSVPGPIAASMRERMVRAANVQRHKKMLDDANKLVQLANELKADVEKTQNDELSVEVMKKAAEVEKLAHDIQQKMKQ